LKHKIERHFNHKWKYDRNQALDEPEEISILEQLPYHVIDKIYRNFLYEQFWNLYRDSVFKIPKNYDDAKKKGNLYN